MLAPPLQRTAAPTPPDRKSSASATQGTAVEPARPEREDLGSIIQRACVSCEEDTSRWQAKYAVHPPEDRWEKEADGVAEAVVRGREAPRLSPVASGGLASGVQRLVNQSSPRAARHRPRTNPSHSPDPVGSALRRPGPGSPLNPAQRARIETPLGADLGSVRVHTGPEAEAATGSVNARAFTSANHIWLGRGESATDDRLMAHEAAHVVQQGAATPQPSTPATSASIRQVQGQPRPPGASPSAAASPAGSISGGKSASTPSSAAGSASAPAGTATPASRGSQSPGGGAPAARGGAASAAPAVAGPAGAPSPAGVGGGAELLMPEPPTGLSAADEARLAQSQAAAGATAATQQSLPAAEENVAGARAAVTEPEGETTARASGALAEALGERPAPSPEIEALCERIREAIRARRPPDEDSLLQSDPQAAAQAAGGELEASVRGDTQRVQGDYDALNQPAQGAPQQQAQPLAPPPAAAAGPPIAATQAVPDAVPAADVSLDADVTASQERMDAAGMNSEPAQLVQSGPIAEAREAQSELSAAAQRDPAEVLAEQTATRAQAAADMAALQEQALTAMQGARTETVAGVTGQQQGMVGSEEQMRQQVSAQAQAIFDSAQSRVNALLEPLPETAMRRWETGVQVLSTRFEQDLSRIEEWKRERYSGVGGALLELWEGVVGLPDEFIRAYDNAERNFGDGVCALIREISTEVNGVIAACEQIIDDARGQIAELFAGLPASLQEWAAGEQARFSQQLDALQERATNARDEFNRNLAERAAQSVQQVRERIHELREAAGGLLGRIAGAVERFLDDPARFIIEGLLELVGIPPASFWAVIDRIGQVLNDIANDPMGFANNLVSALGQGFQRFFDNFGQHIIGGFFDWLFSGLGAVGVQLPSDFSLKSLITFFLQLMGITWERIRQLLARHIGEENVALLERAYELIATLIEQGPSGIFEMIKEQLNPQNLIDQVVRAAVDFLIETLIVRVTARIIAMFNPAGAIIQAIEIIYRVLRWIFDNAARIFSLVETVVNGAADLIAGNLAGMAAAVEGALARLIAPVIDFLAGFLGLGALPDRIADTIRGFQEWVMGILDRVIRWLADRARGLLRALGIGGGAEETAEPGEDLSDHTTLANRIKRDLQDPEGAEGDYDEVRRAKERQAAALEERYGPTLEPGIGLHINFTSRSADAEDDDIDFEVVIAPNTTTVTGSVGLGGSNEPVPVGSWIRILGTGTYERVTQGSSVVRRRAEGSTTPVSFTTDKPDGGGTATHSYSQEGTEWERTNFSHGSNYVMPEGSGANFVLKPPYRGGSSIRSRFYGDSSSSRNAITVSKLPGLLLPTDPSKFLSEASAQEEARHGFPALGGRALVPVGQASPDHDPPIADHWTNRQGNMVGQSTRESWNSALSTYKIISWPLNRRLGSRGENYTDEVGINFRGPGD